MGWNGWCGLAVYGRGLGLDHRRPRPRGAAVVGPRTIRDRRRTSCPRDILGRSSNGYVSASEGQREGHQVDGVSPDPVADRFLCAGEGCPFPLGGSGVGSGGGTRPAPRVLPPLTTYVVADMSAALRAPLQRKTRAAVQRQLVRLETQVKGPNCRTRTVLTEGVLFYEILHAAKRLRCDLIILAMHGRTGLAHAIMGSVAENVIRRASCPVLTVRPPRFRRGL